LTGACTDVDEVPTEPPLDPNQGKSYFFLEEGKFREYEVVEIKYSAVDISDTLAYQIREEVKEALDIEQAEKAHLIYRYSRGSELENWALDSVWSARLESNLAVATENNQSYVKMLFPADTVQSWDRNLFNGKTEEIVKARSFNEPFTIGFNTFLEAMEVQISQADDSVTFRDNRYEVFADSIGLVYKYSEVLTYCSREKDCEIGAKVIESGRYYTETLIAHGFIDEEE
jgi:hypothetical protein